MIKFSSAYLSKSLRVTSKRDRAVEPTDSEKAAAATGDTRLKLGDSADSPVTVRGGKFVFDTANEDMVTGLLTCPLPAVPM